VTVEAFIGSVRKSEKILYAFSIRLGQFTAYHIQ